VTKAKHLLRVPLGIRLQRDGAPLPILPAQNGKGVDPGSALSLSLNRGGEKDHVTRASVDTNHVTALDRDLAAHTLTPDPNQKGSEKVDPVRKSLEKRALVTAVDRAEIAIL